MHREGGEKKEEEEEQSMPSAHILVASVNMQTCLVYKCIQQLQAAVQTSPDLTQFNDLLL